MVATMSKQRTKGMETLGQAAARLLQGIEQRKNSASGGVEKTAREIQVYGRRPTAKDGSVIAPYGRPVRPANDNDERFGCRVVRCDSKGAAGKGETEMRLHPAQGGFVAPVEFTMPTVLCGEGNAPWGMKAKQRGHE